MKSITAQDSYESLKNEEAILIDVREQDEYDEAHIEGAQLAPLSNLPKAMAPIDMPKNKKVILHCLKGGRSAQAIDFLEENILKGFDVYNMEGGILAWIENDLPVIKAL